MSGFGLECVVIMIFLEVVHSDDGLGGDHLSRVVNVLFFKTNLGRSKGKTQYQRGVDRKEIRSSFLPFIATFLRAIYF